MKLLLVLTVLSLLLPRAALASSDADTYLVLGSYRVLQAAKKETERLQRVHGLNLFLASAAGRNGRLYRIMTGPYKEVAARAMGKSLASRGIPDGWIWRGVPKLEYDPGQPPDHSPREAEPPPPEEEIPAAVTDARPVDIQQSREIEEEPAQSYAGVEKLTSSRSWGLRGYLKSYALAQDSVEVDDAPNDLIDDSSIYQSQNSLRLMFEGAPTDALAWELHYELTPVFYSSAVDLNPITTSTITLAGNSYRVADIDPVLGDATDKSANLQNLDRLNVQFRLGFGDLTIGRQAIAFGSARAINPTDVFLPFEVQTLNQEYRIGVDAIRLQQPMGELGELDMGIILGEDADTENSAVFIQTLNNISGMDLRAALMRFSGQNLAGFGIQSSLGDFGFWLEAAHVWNGDEYTRASTGLDYAFSEKVFGMLEYHYNGAGTRYPEQYAGLFDDFAHSKGGVFLLGENYVIPSLNWTATPLLGISLQAIVNLDDSSAFVNLASDYSISENLYSNLGVYIFTGDHLQYTMLPPNLLLGSEYGINPNLMYLSLRYYF
jgi:hypothetical protein